MSMSTKPAPLRRTFTAALALTTVVTVSSLPVRAQAGVTSPPAVSGLSVHSGGTWGGDLLTVRGTGFAGAGDRRVSSVLFGTHPADGFWVVNSTTLRAYSPEVRNRRTLVDLRVVLRDGTRSARTAADRFTFVVPTMNTPLNGHWSAAQSQRVARSMMPRAARLNAAAVAHNPGHWTPAMGRSALRRARGWLGLPYTWAGGSYNGPTYGSCYGDGLIGKFDCKIWGFDCSGLVLYGWGKYRHLAHYAATQRGQAGRFHPTISELQPGDLLFFSGGGPVISHVVMYAGGGRIIQAAESGWPVRYNLLSDVLAGHPRYFGATRPMSTGRQGAPAAVTSTTRARSATAGGATITLHGRHLDTTARVFFGSTGTYRFSIRSSTTITVKVPAHRAGTVNVRVVNAWGMSAVTARARLSYIAPPSLRSASPSSGPTTGGTTVTLTGAGFATGARVYFGTAPATSVRVLSDTTITVVTPPGTAGRVPVSVVTGYGSVKRTVFSFVVPPPPSPSPSPSTSASTAASHPDLVTTRRP